MGYSHDEWTPLIIHEKMAGNWDAQSYDQRIKNKFANNLNKLPQIVDSWTAPIVSDKPWSVIVDGGGLKSLPFCLGTAYNVSSMEDIGNSWSLC